MESDDSKDAEAGKMEPTETLPHIKRVSRIKHAILQRYLPVWAQILGASNQRLCYFDCYAGRGEYEFQGERVEGSAPIAVRAGKDYVSAKSGRLMTVILIERDEIEAKALENCLQQFQPYSGGLQVQVLRGDSQALIEEILAQVNSLAPSFFMIDPYGHPLSIPLINQILERQKTEALINLMWYQINRDLANPAVYHRLDKLFGDGSWRTQPFMNERGRVRERHFLDFFCSRLRGEFVFPFKICFGPEDKIPGNRTKYYLLHVSNHPKAVLMMKEVMWRLGDEDGTFDFSGESQEPLISETPRLEELETALSKEFGGQEVAFQHILEKTWRLPFLEKHYRQVIQGLRSREIVKVRPVTSKKTGLKGQDIVKFP